MIGWSGNDTAGWLTAYQPTLLADGDAPATAPAISDPVVVEGMKTLTAMVNHGNNLAGAMDKRDAVDVLMRLRDAAIVTSLMRCTPGRWHTAGTPAARSGYASWPPRPLPARACSAACRVHCAPTSFRSGATPPTRLPAQSRSQGGP